MTGLGKYDDSGPSTCHGNVLSVQQLRSEKERELGGGGVRNWVFLFKVDFYYAIEKKKSNH